MKSEREIEEDKAQSLRSQMRIVRKPPTKAAPDAGGYKPTLHTNGRAGKPSQRVESELEEY
jgi:hypothetical protein